MSHFKCHSARACHTWAKGGPIDDNETSLDWGKRAGINEVRKKRFDMIYRLDDMDDNYAAVVTAMAKRAGIFLRKRNVSMNRSAVELKGDVKKIDKFIRSLPESNKFRG